MASRLFRLTAGMLMALLLTGCVLPRSSPTPPPLSPEPPELVETEVETPLPVESSVPTLEPTPDVGGFDPLALECIVGTWEVDSASLVYAANMLIGSDTLNIVNVSPHLFFQFSWDEPLLGATHVMEVFYIGVSMSGVFTAGEDEHLLDLVYDGSTTAYFNAGASAGEFAYENDLERSNMAVSGLKIDGIALDDGAFSLNDIIGAVPEGTMFYSCESADVIKLRDGSAAEFITLHRVDASALPSTP